MGIEVAANLAEHVVLAWFLQIRRDDLLRIGFRLGAGESHLLCRPQAEQLVAPRGRLESQFLVVGELLLEAFLALVERGHCLSRSSAAAALASVPDTSAGAARRVAFRGFNDRS